jgi:hypothetical protein
MARSGATPRFLAQRCGHAVQVPRNLRYRLSRPLFPPAGQKALLQASLPPGEGLG